MSVWLLILNWGVIDVSLNVEVLAGCYGLPVAHDSISYPYVFCHSKLQQRNQLFLPKKIMKICINELVFIPFLFTMKQDYVKIRNLWLSKCCWIWYTFFSFVHLLITFSSADCPCFYLCHDIVKQNVVLPLLSPHHWFMMF